MLYSNELTVTVGAQSRKVFLQNGFYSSEMPTRHMHRHNYSEIHLVSGGQICFSVDDKEYTVSDGSLLVIPKGIFHGCIFMDEGAKHCAFQIDRDFDGIEEYSVNGSVVSAFIDEIGKCGKNGDHGSISAYITLMCSYFSPSVEAQRVTDAGFLISEFFLNKYGGDVHLEELAEILHLSPRQAERVIEAYTGRTFRGELTATRMSVADRLISASDMPLCEVSQYVGYRSYAGFWKAYRKYKKDLKEGADNEGNR